jgi:hypothetical protein
VEPPTILSLLRWRSVAFEDVHPSPLRAKKSHLSIPRGRPLAEQGEQVAGRGQETNLQDRSAPLDTAVPSGPARI